jgi:hypothetical protein
MSMMGLGADVGRFEASVVVVLLGASTAYPLLRTDWTLSLVLRQRRHWIAVLLMTVVMMTVRLVMCVRGGYDHGPDRLFIYVIQLGSRESSW